MLKYKYPLFGFIIIFSITLIGITIEDIIHEFSLVYALSSLHHYYTPIILGIIGAILGYVLKRIQIKESNIEFELAISKDKFKVLYEKAPLSYQSLDKNGRFIDINPAWESTFGYSKEEVLGNYFHEYMTPESSKLQKEKFSKFLTCGEVSGVEFEMINKAGKHISVNLFGKVNYDENNKVINTHCILADISEQKSANEALLLSEERFKRLSDLTFEGILIHENGIVKEMNESLQKMLGYSENELYGKNALDTIVHPDYKNEVNKYINWDQSPPYEIMAIKKDGNNLHIEIESHNMDYMGRTLRVTAVRNITKRKEAQSDLKRFHTAVEQSATSIVITDNQGHIQYANTKFYEQTGYLPGEVLGKTPSILKSGKHNTQFYNILWEIINKGEVWNAEICNKKKNGELYWEKMTITPVLNDSGEIINFIAVKEDITDKKQTERNLLNAIIDTEEKERKRFAENLHDELGPFLSGINLYINELRYEDVDYEKRLSLIDYLNYFVNEAVEKTRSISHQLMPNILYDYGLVVALESFCNKINKAKNISIKLNSNIKKTIGNKTLEVVLYRMAIELINNTMKHANATEITIDLVIDEEIFQFIYSDNGIGFNLDEKLKDNSGLGLQNTINRLKSIEGNYEFSSNKNKGVLYKFVIPL